MNQIRFVIKYAIAGLFIALAYLVLFSDSEASLELRKWISSRLVVNAPATQTPVFSPIASYADAIEKASPTVVSIQTVGKGTLSLNPDARNEDEQYVVNVGLNVGSGIIIDKRGYVVTNYHVVRDAKSIKVELSDKREKIATVVGVDPFLDLAVLHIALDNLPTPIINPERPIRTGDVVFAIGNPYGRLAQTVTMGIVSATRTPADRNFPERLQTDVAIHPGNSGGALINAYGELIGINNMQLASQMGGAQTGISFTIPYYEIERVVADLIELQGKPSAYLGFSVSQLHPTEVQQLLPQNIDPNLGVIITDVQLKSPALKGGLLKGDYAISMNEQPIKSIRQLAQMIRKVEASQSITLTIVRSKQIQKIIIVAEEQNAQTIEDNI